MSQKSKLSPLGTPEAPRQVPVDYADYSPAEATIYAQPMPELLEPGRFPIVDAAAKIAVSQESTVSFIPVKVNK